MPTSTRRESGEYSSDATRSSGETSAKRSNCSTKTARWSISTHTATDPHARTSSTTGVNSSSRYLWMEDAEQSDAGGNRDIERFFLPVHRYLGDRIAEVSKRRRKTPHFITQHEQRRESHGELPVIDCARVLFDRDRENPFSFLLFEKWRR